MLRRMVQEGLVARLGTGGRTAPYLYQARSLHCSFPWQQ